MGIKQSPDVAQEHMENIFRDLNEVNVYVDDIGVFSNSWEEHLASLHKVLTILQTANFTVNPLKCKWAVKETDWLGYWLTPTSLKPWRKKVDAILALERPQPVTQLRSLIGAITFSREMFPHQSHHLAPLTAQVGKKILNWTPECQTAFDTIKALIAKDAFICYPNHNKPFHIYCDASHYQLGAAIFQEGAPDAYFSRKLTASQKNYTVGEKELLSIVETLKEYRTMLFGCPDIHVYTDHHNNTFATQHVLRWRLFLEEYAPTFHYIKGKMNTLADALSRLPFLERQKAPSTNFDAPSNDSHYSMAIDNPSLLDCFVHLLDQAGVPFVLTYENIAEAQAGGAELLQFIANEPNKFVSQILAPNISVYCHIRQPNEPWKIYLPTELLDSAIRWYHLALSHIGNSRLYDTMSLHFYHRSLKNTIEALVSSCDTCQRLKLVGQGHGHVAPREAELMPWCQIAVDLVGPWTLRVGPQEMTFMALTIIDMYGHESCQSR
jgi:hypothetical protein